MICSYAALKRAPNGHPFQMEGCFSDPTLNVSHLSWLSAIYANIVRYYWPLRETHDLGCFSTVRLPRVYSAVVRTFISAMALFTASLQYLLPQIIRSCSALLYDDPKLLDCRYAMIAPSIKLFGAFFGRLYIVVFCFVMASQECLRQMCILGLVGSSPQNITRQHLCRYCFLSILWNAPIDA